MSDLSESFDMFMHLLTREGKCLEDWAEYSSREHDAMAHPDLVPEIFDERKLNQASSRYYNKFKDYKK